MRRRGLGPEALLVLIFAAVVAAQTEDLPVTEEEPWNIEAKTSNAVKDSAGTHIFSFEHDVVITHGELRATSDAARYLEGVNRALLSGNVVMQQQESTVRGPSAIYDRITKVARFPEGIFVERPTGTAVANEGVWERDRDLFELRGDASAADTAATVQGQSLTYDATADIFHARGDAEIVDKSSGMHVRGGFLEYDRKRSEARATRSPEAEFSEREGEEPVKVFAETLIYDPRADIAVAIKQVKILRDSMEANADSATFYRKDNRAVLVGSPKMVDGPTEISGERMEILELEPGKRRVVVEGSARIQNTFELPPSTPKDSASASASFDSTGAAVDSSVAQPPAGAIADSARAGAPADTLVRAPADSALIRAAGPADSLAALGDSAAALTDSAIVIADSSAAAADSAAADKTPAWLKTPADKLPMANLLFGDRMVLDFENNDLVRVEVTGHSRSKFYPDEKKDVEEWNDVTGDNLNAWFTQSAVDSVTVSGNGSGEYRMGPGPGEKSIAGESAEQLLERGRIVRYRAPQIRYQHKEEKMHLDRGAEVEYKTMVLKAGTIEFDSKKEVLDASGDPAPTLVDKRDQISGEEMRYHLGKETGEILLGRTRFENGYYSGQEVWRLNDDVLAIHDAAFTTCDLAAPHYHFTSKRMKIYPNDKMVAKPVVLKIRNIPVLALPFYTASLVRDRHSGFLIPNLELGVDDERGRFIRKVGYYWVPNDYTDFTTSFDFYPEQERFVGYLSGRYSLRYRFSGRAEIKYNRDVPANSKDTAFEFDHRQTFSDTMELTASGSFLSSSSIYRDIDDSRRLDRDIRSHATLSKRFTNSNQSVRAEVERRENLDTGQISSTLPIIQYSLPSRTIGGKESNLYYGSDARFVHVSDRDSTAEEKHTGARIGGDLRSTVSLQPYARITPSLTAEGVWIDEDKEGDPNAFRGTFSTNVGATSTIYGTFLKRMGPVTGIRHVFEPQASWSWAPEFENYFFTDSTGVRQDRFFTFGGIGGTPSKTNRGSLSIRNLIQTKILRRGQEQRYDLFTLRHSISYDFLADEFGRKPLSNLTSSLNVLSSLPINQTWSVIHDVYDGDVVNTSVTTQMRLNSTMFRRGIPTEGKPVDFANPPADFEKPPVDSIGAPPTDVNAVGGVGTWTLDASHSFQRGGPNDHSSWLVLGTSWVPTEKWRVTFNTQYDLKTGENTAQEWSVHRTIHCWELSFDRRLLGGDWQYYFRINITQLPDIQAEHGDLRGRSSLPGLDTLGGY